MGTKPVILLTGFEPFGGSDVNPSILACRRLEGRKFNGFQVVVEEIPLRFREIKGIIEGYIEKHRPSAVICTGQSSRAFIALERIAINVGDARNAYNCGYKPVDARLNEDGPDGIFSKLPLRSLLEALKEAKIPVEVSNSAGTYGCNQVFYHLMDCLAKEEIDIPAGFIHVPCLPEQAIDKTVPSMTLDLIARALEVAVGVVTSRI